LDIWHVYAVVFLLGTIQGLNMPARQAIVADLVERDNMMNAVALHTLVNQTGQIIGPAAAGGIIELVGIGPTLLVNAGLYLSGIGFLLFITELPRRSATKGVTLLVELGAGLQCVRSTPILLTVIGMTLAFAFFALSFRQVMPAIAQEVLEIGAGGTGLLLLAVGLGSLFGNLILAGLGDFRRKTSLLMASVLLQSMFLTLFAWSPWPWVSWIILLFVGAMSFGFFVPLVVTLIQLNVPPELRGRVLSILGLAPAVHYLGALPLALAANAISWPVAVTAGAGLSMLVALWLGVWRPVLRQLAE
jgi:predicted MFS family arabinose efflux permease